MMLLPHLLEVPMHAQTAAYCSRLKQLGLCVLHLS